MATPQKDARAALMEDIIRLGKLAYDPEGVAEDSLRNVANFNHLLVQSSLLNLIPVLTALVQPGRLEEWLRPHLTRTLALLPLRPRGVRNTIEFILSIHPSTASRGRAKDSSNSTGANVSLEALTSASKLISAPPTGMAADVWFTGIAPQLFSLLDGEGGLEMVKAASYIIGFGILGRREYGSPGCAGWKAFAEPLLSSINPSLATAPITPPTAPNDLDIIDLSTHKTLVSASKLADALRRLASLLSSHPNPALSKRLLGNLMLPLWSLFSWPATGTEYEAWRAPAGYLLQIYLQLSESTKLVSIMNDINFDGIRNSRRACWRYKAVGDGILVERLADESMETSQPLFDNLDAKIEAFIALLQQIRDGDAIPHLFLDLCRKWLSSSSQTPKKPVIIAIAEPQPDSDGDSERQLVEAKITQKMMQDMPEKLVGDSTQVLSLAADVLLTTSKPPSSSTTSSPSSTADLEDDSIAIALSLLNIVFTSPSFNQTQHASILPAIQSSLKRISQSSTESSRTAGNLLLLLEMQRSSELEDPTAAAVRQTLAVDPHAEDRRTHQLALHYLTSVDSPPPVRAQGLTLLTTLIQKVSPIISIPTTMVLLTSLLSDEEEYIYLRAIKALVSLSLSHPSSVSTTLLDTYADPQEQSSLDVRLRTGEALLQIIQAAPASSTLRGPTAPSIAATLLAVASRRGQRLKTRHRAQKAAKLADARTKDFSRAWDGLDSSTVAAAVAETGDGADADAGDDDGNDGRNEVDNAVLRSIVDGWEATAGRGHEDPRMRASALSLLTTLTPLTLTTLPTPLLNSILDLCLQTLTLEPSPPSTIVRRASLQWILSLLQAVESAGTRRTGVKFGFSVEEVTDVKRVVGYVRDTDSDGLVREFAGEVLERLDATWGAGSLMRGVRERTMGVGAGSAGVGVGGIGDGMGFFGFDGGRTLAGLSLDVGPETAVGSRPRIEEIE